MELYFIKGACNITTGYFSIQNRLAFEGIQEPSSSSKGIRYHNFIVAFILRFFSNKMIVSIKDIDGKIYHLNRGSLSDWLIKYHDDLKSTSKNSMLIVTEYAMRRWLNDVLEKKSPSHIVNISKIKNELTHKERQKIDGDKHGWNSIAHNALPQEILVLKNQLSDAEAERLKSNAN